MKKQAESEGRLVDKYVDGVDSLVNIQKSHWNNYSPNAFCKGFVCAAIVHRYGKITAERVTRIMRMLCEKTKGT